MSEADTRYDTLDDVPRAANTVGFVLMVEEGAFAVADHAHASEWSFEPYPEAFEEAAEQLALGAAGGGDARPAGRSNYGFLDGHAATLRFDEVFCETVNRFDPAQAR